MIEFKISVRYLIFFYFFNVVVVAVVLCLFRYIAEKDKSIKM